MLRDLLALIENGAPGSDVQVIIGHDLFEVRSAGFDTDGDLVLYPDLSQTA